MKKKELILNKPSENKFYYQCVYNKIKKRQCYSLSTPEQKKPLYRSYSPRLQFLFDEKIDEITKLYKEAWVSVEFLTYGNVKIEKVQYSNIDNEFTLEIIIGENISRKLKTMSHFVCDIKEFINSKPKRVNVILNGFDKNNNALMGKIVSTTDPYEDYPLIPIENEDFDQKEQLVNN